VGERWVKKLKKILSSLPKARAQGSGAPESIGNGSLKTHAQQKAACK
jgi:hypothetical protein